jgi:hypothetical protein
MLCETGQYHVRNVIRDYRDKDIGHRYPRTKSAEDFPRTKDAPARPAGGEYMTQRKGIYDECRITNKEYLIMKLKD